MPVDHLTRICQQYRAVLLSIDATTVRIAVNNTPPTSLTQALTFASNKQVEIENWDIEKLEKYQLSQQNNTLFHDEQDSAAALIDNALEHAVARRASDIHIEPGENNGRIRLRIDGVLQQFATFSPTLSAAIVARLKILGNMDIAERRRPQDGQFDPDIQGERLSLRLSTLPCRHGEKVVLRLLRQQSRPLQPDALGMPAETLASFQLALAKPQGLVLVTGPTGSGKTLTLYSALSSLNHPGVNIACVEDPVEIPLNGLTQTQINPKAGLTFQTVLRSLLRQDPDIIMIGEIRDSETAEIALKAAQTGHLVLSTLHTHSTVETLTRLEQMGMPRWQIASALELIVAQRLVRRLCPHCKQPGPALTLPKNICTEPLTAWQPKGCERCYNGYYDRMALFEILLVDDTIRRAIIGGLPAHELERLSRQRGMATLLESGLDAVKRGFTTPEELWRVLGMPNAER